MNNMGKVLREACGRQFGVLSGSFLCKSLSTLGLKQPISVTSGTSVQEVLGLLRDNKIGAVLVVNERGAVLGIFTERDCVLKVLDVVKDLGAAKVDDFMTKDPVKETPECSIAYALNLMSSGGFRHLPIVDDEDKPIGVISVKDVVDAIVGSFLDDVMSLETELS